MNQDKQSPEASAATSEGDPQEHVETAILPDEMLEEMVAAGRAAGDPDALAEELAAARAEAEQNWNKCLRLTAEMDNLRKRQARELDKARNFGVEGLAGELLAVADSLEMGLEAAGSATLEALVDGQRGTLKQLQAALNKYGVERVEPEGEPFDPELHEAMTLQPSNTAEPNTVLTVVQTGYTLNGRLLRPARVVVAREPDPAA
ncbi:MAG: nucleotide exchange factor GrpE [Gammaproteobacteria bacterium]|jgi:molecular chaperone GrpE|nr:nucleotide exchange factor GrpE [Gammaproteobacteria bacterium]